MATVLIQALLLNGKEGVFRSEAEGRKRRKGGLLEEAGAGARAGAWAGDQGGTGPGHQGALGRHEDHCQLQAVRRRNMGGANKLNDFFNRFETSTLLTRWGGRVVDSAGGWYQRAVDSFVVLRTQTCSPD